MTGGIIPTPKKRPREVSPPSDLILANKRGYVDGLANLPMPSACREFPLLLVAYRQGYRRGSQERAAAEKGQVTP